MIQDKTGKGKGVLQMNIFFVADQKNKPKIKPIELAVCMGSTVMVKLEKTGLILVTQCWQDIKNNNDDDDDD